MKARSLLILGLAIASTAHAERQTGVLATILDPIGGATSGLLYSATGGAPRIDFDVFPAGLSTEWGAARIHYDELEITFADTTSSLLRKLMGRTLAGGGSLFDFTLTAPYRRDFAHTKEFQQWRVSEMGFPALDAGSKEHATFYVKLEPGDEQPEADVLFNPKEYTVDKSRVYSKGDFHLQIDGVDCSRVSKIDAFKINVIPVENADGTSGFGFMPGDFTITMPVADAQGLMKEFDGNLQQFTLHNGQLDYIDVSGNVGLSLVLTGLGVVSVSPSFDDFVATETVTFRPHRGEIK